MPRPVCWLSKAGPIDLLLLETALVEEKEFYRILGWNIRTERNRLNISQEKLSDIANLHRTHIGMIERNERKPSAFTLKKIADALNVSIDYLTRNDG